MANPTNPSLLTPVDTAIVVGNVLVFTFTAPSDTDNQKLVFRLELDTNNPIDSEGVNYKAFESRLSSNAKIHGTWEVDNGSGTFIAIPTGGMASTYYGNTARVKIRKQDVSSYPDIKTVWYWRIGASDAMIHPPVFNQVIFAQCRFGE